MRRRLTCRFAPLTWSRSGGRCARLAYRLKRKKQSLASRRRSLLLSRTPSTPRCRRRLQQDWGPEHTVKLNKIRTVTWRAIPFHAGNKYVVVNVVNVVDVVAVIAAVVVVAAIIIVAMLLVWFRRQAHVPTKYSYAHIACTLVAIHGYVGVATTVLENK